MSQPVSSAAAPRWYAGVTPYQWLVLVIASAGWVFDAFEGQIFNLTRNDLLTDLLKVNSTHSDVLWWGEILLGVFLAGGTFGGILFGSLADRWGRRPTMVVTILFYSIFSGLTFFVTELWQVATLRFLVAMGVGGEWAVAAALVAEVFPRHARAHASGIFHATSTLGTWLAMLAGLWVGANWRYAFVVGVLPALLTLWVRAGIREPERWKTAKAQASAGTGEKLGSFRELLLHPVWGRRAILGMLLAIVGLASFWGVTIAGQDLAREMKKREAQRAAVLAPAATGNPTSATSTSGGGFQDLLRNEKFAYGFIQAAGGGLGLLAFGPICVRLGRKRTFILLQIGALIIVPATCYLPTSYNMLVAMLPFYGFFTLGIHAGFAVYFPELFPNHLRSTGSGFCFNGGRLGAAFMMWFSGWLKSRPGMELPTAITLLSFIFLIGIGIVLFLPETKDQPLPE